MASDYFFCAAQASQCFSTAKAWSLVLVVLGTTTYALSGRAPPAPEENMEEIEGTDYRAYTTLPTPTSPRLAGGEAQ